MNTEVARRMLKLGSTANLSVKQAVQTTLQINRSAVQQRLQEIEEREPQPKLSALETLDFRSDTLILLPGLDSYLESTARRQVYRGTSIFRPAASPTKYNPPQLPIAVSTRNAEYLLHNLHAFEAWVA
ncbi:hypothetical protein LTR62_000905 [Meristemomyces frigidus]|uniref:Uncharacterized protein n=1 Tax=Meristemomyces frigidus TaxID=1508187 RepID=A0AAN7T8Y7_9PEZI|nr:hypothetical protein LTR62_000905 [Meristemomyces frigidus]